MVTSSPLLPRSVIVAESKSLSSSDVVAEDVGAHGGDLDDVGDEESGHV